MADNVPSSPIPGGSETTESTRLLNTTTSSYNTREAVNTTRQTVITMSSEQGNGHSYSTSNGGTAASTSHHHIQNIISAGQPIIPTQQLTEKIQDILVFTEIKKNQQERVINKENKDKYRSRQKDQQQQVPAPDTSSSSSSDSDSDDGSLRLTLKKKLSEWSIDGGNKKSVDEGVVETKKLRKRDFAVDALKFATDKWKVKHGYETGSNPGSSASLLPQQNNSSTAATATTTTVTTALLNSFGNGNEASTTVIQQKKQEQSKAIPSSAENIFDVAKNASVCAVMALLHERRQSSGHSVETDISLQSLALSTLNLGLKVHDTSASQVILYEMLTNKWMNGKSALEWAVENDSQLILNDKRVQVVIEELWKSGPNWRQDPNHPSNIWLDHPTSPTNNQGNNTTAREPEESKNFAWYVIQHTFIEFLARWPSPRYQALIALFSILGYLVFHLSSVTNIDYTSDTPFLYEYIYYVLVISDFSLEYYKLFTQPCAYLKKISSYISLVTASLLFAAFIIRFFALIAVDNLSDEVYFIQFSFNLIIIATPLMFFRVFSASTSLWWSSAKISYILHSCFLNSLWVFTLGLFVVLGFWVSLAALQYSDVSPLSMLRYLLLGALHAPTIGDTLMYQPEIASLLLGVYLFFTVIVLGALLTASFLGTILQIYAQIDKVRREWVLNRCLKSVPVLGKFIPSVAVDLVFAFIAWTARVIFKRRDPIVWLEKVHQVLWYIIYSPVIFLVGFYELFTLILFRWTLVSNAFKRVPINTASYK